MSEKHTSGPWKYIPRHIAESEPEVRAPDGWLICCTSSDIDARLIASAPDLLNALSLMIEAATYGSFSHSDTHPLPMARRALIQACANEQYSVSSQISDANRYKAALEEILYQRPAGDCKNKTIIKMERIAMMALHGGNNGL